MNGVTGLAACLLMLAEAGGAGAPRDLPAAHRFAEPGLAFEVPDGFLVEASHFAPDLPAHKAVAIYRFEGAGGAPLTLDVFRNPSSLPLQEWFDQNLSFLLSTTAEARSLWATRYRVPALQIDQPASPQAPAMRTVVFALGTRVFRATAFGSDAPEVQALLDRVLSTLDVGSGP